METLDTQAMAALRLVQSLNSPAGVAADNLGNVFIADTFNFCIRKVDGSGIITTVAGHGVDDNNIDGIPATQSSLSYPNGVAVDARENIFIADTFQNRIRAVWAGQSTFSLTNVAQASAGTYDVVVTGLGGSVTSSPVTLTVVIPPSISTQPLSQSVAVGRAAMLSVTATGTPPLAYQWSFGATLLVGETNSELLIGSADFTNAGNYQVTVTNLYGSATSSVAAVNIGYPPAITSQSSNLIVLVGGNTLLSAGVTGSGLLSLPMATKWHQPSKQCHNDRGGQIEPRLFRRFWGGDQCDSQCAGRYDVRQCRKFIRCRFK